MWKTISASGFAGALSFGFIMIQVDEYIAAIVMWFVAAIVFISQVVGWKAPMTGGSLFIAASKIFGILVALAFVIVMGVWPNTKRLDKPWSVFMATLPRLSQEP